MEKENMLEEDRKVIRDLNLKSKRIKDDKK